MLRKLINQSLNLNNEIFEIYYAYFHKRIFISLFVVFRRLILILFFAILSLIIKKYQYLLITLSYIILALEILELIKEIKYFGILRTKFQVRGMYLQNFLIALLIPPVGKVITKADWKNIKRKDKELYKAAKCDESCGYCYSYCRDLALLLSNATIIYCIIYEPNHPHGVAHAIIHKDDEVYDTNMRQHFKYEDYLKLHHVKIYKEFEYEDYNKEKFHSFVRKDFVKFCSQYHVTVYST
ncbi:MAG: hypothetical protein Q4D02_04995 [Clostridia bacterium]|nr:hypothetical protein [Clostridia bacterium]